MKLINLEETKKGFKAFRLLLGPMIVSLELHQLRLKLLRCTEINLKKILSAMSLQKNYKGLGIYL